MNMDNERLSNLLELQSLDFLKTVIIYCNTKVDLNNEHIIDISRKIPVQNFIFVQNCITISKVLYEKKKTEEERIEKLNNTTKVVLDLGKTKDFRDKWVFQGKQ